MIISNRPLQLLLIEDNQFFAMVIQQVLEEQGHDCKVVSLMVQAFELFQSENFNLCICDYNIPDSDGAESIRTLKKLAGTPLILISGDPNPLGVSLLVSEKIVNQFIAKPFTKELLIDSVNKLIF